VVDPGRDPRVESCALGAEQVEAAGRSATHGLLHEQRQVHARDHFVDVDAFDDRIHVDSFEERVEVDAVHHRLDVNVANHGIDRHESCQAIEGGSSICLTHPDILADSSWPVVIDPDGTAARGCLRPAASQFAGTADDPEVKRSTWSSRSE
jgi:hypothetical protein